MRNITKDLTWRIYYGDGSVYDDTMGKAEDAPTLDVQVIADNSDGLNGLIHKRDFYWLQEDGWYGGDMFGLFDYLMRPGMKKVLFGRSIPTKEFDAIVARAIKDRET